MAAPGWGRWVLGLGPLLLQVFLPFQLVAGRWGPEGAGGGLGRSPSERAEGLGAGGVRRAGTSGRPGQLHASTRRLQPSRKTL